jgi:hypothetical protein
MDVRGWSSVARCYVPLAKYGVVIGTLNQFKRDSLTDYGDYYHGKIYVDTPAGHYECAVDFSTPLGIEVQFRVVYGLNSKLFSRILSLPDGYHHVVKTPSSGALDYVRSPLLGLWVADPPKNGIDVLEGLLMESRRLFVFGEPYRHRRRRGMHNVHYNQGDPPGPHRRDNGIWQDGGVVMQQANGELVAFLIKFASQSLTTDENGLPI